MIPADFKFSSPESQGNHYCADHCSCCGGCNERGKCVKGGGQWKCDCSSGSFGPNCKYGVDSTDGPGGDPSQKGLCRYMSELCLNGGKCVPSNATSLGFHCDCRQGFRGLYCQENMDKMASGANFDGT